MKQPVDKTEFQKDQNSNIEQVGKQYSEEEYKNAQAFGTKANQERIELAKKLVEISPEKIEELDVATQNKVIKDLWGYENLEELKIMLPNYGKTEDEDEDNDLSTIKRELELQRYKLFKRDIDDEIEKYISSNPNIEGQIPNLKEKIKEELKYISDKIDSKDRVQKAIKLITSNTDIETEAYLKLQGKSFINSQENNIDEESVKDIQNRLREKLGLKRK